MNFNQWLDTFIEEKGIDTEHVFTIETDDFWQCHIIPLEVVIEAAKATTVREQVLIKDTLIKVDFINGDVMHYFEFLAGALAKGMAA